MTAFANCLKNKIGSDELNLSFSAHVTPTPQVSPSVKLNKIVSKTISIDENSNQNT